MTIAQKATSLRNITQFTSISQIGQLGLWKPLQFSLALLMRLCWQLWSYTIILSILLLTLGSLVGLWLHEKHLRTIQRLQPVSQGTIAPASNDAAQ